MRRFRKSRRSGAAALEAAIVLPVFFIMVFGMFDLSIALLRNELLSAVARRGARMAMVHGQLAVNAGRTSWPAVTTYANSSGTPIVDKLSPLLVGFDLSKTQIKLEYPDGSTGLQKRVRVTITSPHTPIVTSLFGSATLNLSASSTMPIAF
jgi:Flp pilus assembly protein TadG